MLLEYEDGEVRYNDGWVLILIVMEDALRVESVIGVRRLLNTVLILIVMEDALRGQISKFPDIPNPLSLFM